MQVTGLVPDKLVNEYLNVKNYDELEQFVERYLRFFLYIHLCIENRVALVGGTSTLNPKVVGLNPCRGPIDLSI